MTKKSSKSIRHLTLAIGIAAALTGMALITACDVESANGAARSVNVKVGGFYSNRSEDGCDNNGRFVTANTGSAVTSFNIVQTGDQLQAIDNNGFVYRGTIGAVVENTASFTLEGATSAGNAVTVTGTFEIEGGGATMMGTWIEPSLFSTLCGTSDGQFVEEPDNDTNTTTNASFRIESLMPADELADYRKTSLWFTEG